MKLLILGSGTGGLFAAVTVKKRMRDAEIVFIDKKDFELLHPCGLPYVIEGKVESFDELKGTLPDMGFTKKLKHEALGIMPDKKAVLVKNLDTSEEFEETYDKLLIATGSSALVPPVPGAKELLGKGVFKVDSFDESYALAEYAKNSKMAIVVGAGAIGLETAVALRAKGLEVTVVEMMEYSLARAIDPDIAKILDDSLTATGINMMFSSKLEQVKGSDKVESVTVAGNDIQADIVILAAGVRSNTDLLADSGIELGKWGIKVNEKMQTNIEDIYAVGDCVQIKSLIDKRDWMMQLAVAAYKQGMVAGTNIIGKDASYKGALTTFSSKIGNLEVAATGFNSSCAECDIITGKSTGQTKPHWCQGGTEITVKILCDNKGRIIGGQAIGEYGAASRINVLSIAIQAGFSVHQLSETELTYCPAISETYDVLMKAADNCIRKMEGK